MLKRHIRSALVKKAAITAFLGLSFTMLACTPPYDSTNNMAYEASDSYKTGDFTFAANDVDSVEINWTAGRVNVTQTDSGKLNCYESGSNSLSEENKLHYIIEGKTLKIQYTAASYDGNIDASLKDLNIELPINCNLKITTLSANVSLADGEYTDVNIESNTGMLSTETIKANYLSLKTSTGTIKVKEVDAKKVDAESVSGGVTVKTVAGATVTFKSVSGIINGRNDVDRTGSKVYEDSVGEAKRQVNIVTDSGSITF